MAKIFEKLIFGGLHEKHAVQRTLRLFLSLHYVSPRDGPHRKRLSTYY
jgi:hypothetical protein